MSQPTPEAVRDAVEFERAKFTRAQLGRDAIDLMPYVTKVVLNPMDAANARRIIYRSLMAGGDHSPARSEKASETIEALLDGLSQPLRELHAPNARGNCSNRCYAAGMAPAKSPCDTIRLLDALLEAGRG